MVKHNLSYAKNGEPCCGHYGYTEVASQNNACDVIIQILSETLSYFTSITSRYNLAQFSQSSLGQKRDLRTDHSHLTKSLGRHRTKNFK